MMKKKIGGKRYTPKVFLPKYKSNPGLPKNWAVRSSGYKKIEPVTFKKKPILTVKPERPYGLGWGP